MGNVAIHLGQGGGLVVPSEKERRGQKGGRLERRRATIERAEGKIMTNISSNHRPLIL